MSLCLSHLKETCIPNSVKVNYYLVIGNWAFGHENLLIYLSDHQTIASQGAISKAYIINQPSLNQLFTVTCVAGVERGCEGREKGEGIGERRKGLLHL